MKQVLMIAAEASSSLFAQRLLEHWQSQRVKVRAFGVGSNAMEKLGFERFGKAEEMAVVGAAEVIQHYNQLKAIFYQLVEQAKVRRPDVVVLLDYPGFNLKFAKEMKKLNIPVVYYISPQIWAWKQGRVHTIKKYVQKMLVVFPFEVDFYKRFDVPAEFVGHPLLDELDEKYFSKLETATYRQRYGILDDEIVIGLMPGSRRSEIKKHLGIQLDVAAKLVKNYAKIKVVIMVAPTVEKEVLQNEIKDVSFPYILMKDDPFRMIQVTDYVLAASGTATLMVGLLSKPMVVMYILNPITAFIGKLIVKSKFFGIVNLILDHEVVPERFQERANVNHLYDLMKKYLDDKEHTDSVRKKLSTLKDKLGSPGATVRVARALQEYLK